MEDLYAAPGSLADQSYCTFHDAVSATVGRAREKVDSITELVILIADDHTRSPPPRHILHLKRKEDKPFDPAPQDKQAWANLAELCKQLDSVLAAGTATEQEAAEAWGRVRYARVPDILQLGSFMRAEAAVKRVLITRVLQSLQGGVISRASSRGRPVAVVCDYQHHTPAVLHGPVNEKLSQLTEYLHAHPHHLGESDHKVRWGVY
jgi:hypothetical protein